MGLALLALAWPPAPTHCLTLATQALTAFPHSQVTERLYSTSDRTLENSLVQPSLLRNGEAELQHRKATVLTTLWRRQSQAWSAPEGSWPLLWGRQPWQIQTPVGFQAQLRDKEPWWFSGTGGFQIIQFWSKECILVFE